MYSTTTASSATWLAFSLKMRQSGKAKKCVLSYSPSSQRLLIFNGLMIAYQAVKFLEKLLAFKSLSRKGKLLLKLAKRLLVKEHRDCLLITFNPTLSALSFTSERIWHHTENNNRQRDFRRRLEHTEMLKSSGSERIIIWLVQLSASHHIEYQ